MILKINNPLVSVSWLMLHIDEPNLIVLDATINKVTADISKPEATKQIKNTRFLDLKNKFSDSTAEFPNTMLSPEKFSQATRKLGINKDTVIIVYDRVGIYSSARVWWMFKAMGHHNIAVLDGGFPAWTTAGFPVEKPQEHIVNQGDFTANFSQDFFYNYDNMLDAITDANKLIIDARSAERFNGSVSEPRKGLRSGQLPNSISLPYAKLQEDGKMKPHEELTEIFKEVVLKDKKLIFSCGSGITACVLALGAELAGIKNTTVYDGSWTEWGSLYSDK